ncbi:hypothetical protein KZZ52_33810 [Dactylosporangium sp. AC04546]|uniref:hypothetical protein n=1 Tax=Dactylosporangium sp. AC04546 TaxID=2862460 RepID=UPI001EDCD305|nr:hypothetical protein [Dactylosporangium sp. AC04546]WVK78952.1 hypothetical protein KZZ52_33810 [Dactylosporangium sp. AC04546]
MARSYAHIVTAIWTGAFRTLQAADQRTYLMLVTQPDISAAGVLALRARRWSTFAPDSTAEEITASLERLAGAGYVVIDPDEEELLVRHFVQQDNGYSNSKRRQAILAAAGDVRSPAIRRALAAEFRRLGLPTGQLDDDSTDANDPSSPTVAPDALVGDDRSDPPPGGGGTAGTAGTAYVEGPSGAPSNGPRVVDTNGRTGSAPTTNLHPPPPRQPAPEQHARTSDTVAALVAVVHRIRPEWSPRSIRRALTHTDVLDRPWPLVWNAAISVARDRTSQVPGRLPHDGPWWTPPAPPPAPPHPPPVTPTPHPADEPGWRSLPAYGAPRRTSATSSAAAEARTIADAAGQGRRRSSSPGTNGPRTPWRPRLGATLQPATAGFPS